MPAGMTLYAARHGLPWARQSREIPDIGAEAPLRVLQGCADGHVRRAGDAKEAKEDKGGHGGRSQEGVQSCIRGQEPHAKYDDRHGGTVSTSQPTTSSHSARQPSTQFIQLIQCFHPLQDMIFTYSRQEKNAHANQVRKALAQPASPSAPAGRPDA